MEIRITCINKDQGNHTNEHEGITHYGWLVPNGNSGKFNRTQMVDWLDKKNKAYVQSGLKKAYCYVRTNPKDSVKFVQTYADSTYSDNLLSLPECK
jgi:hypothetical protein